MKRIPWNKIAINQDFFKTINRESAYVLGFVAADGHLDIKRNRLQIQLSIKDIEHLKKITKLMNSEHEVKDYGHRCSFLVNSSVITDDLISLGMSNDKTNLVFPNIETCYYRDFIRGYFDGDGSFFIGDGKRSGRVTPELICSIVGTYGILEKIKTSFDVYYNKATGYFKDQSKWYNAWKLRYSSAASLAFGDYIYKDTSDSDRLTRKYDKYLYIKNKEYTNSDLPSV